MFIVQIFMMAIRGLMATCSDRCWPRSGLLSAWGRSSRQSILEGTQRDIVKRSSRGQRDNQHLNRPPPRAGDATWACTRTWSSSRRGHRRPRNCRARRRLREVSCWPRSRTRSQFEATVFGTNRSFADCQAIALPRAVSTRDDVALSRRSWSSAQGGQKTSSGTPSPDRTVKIMSVSSVIGILERKGTSAS